MAVDMVFCFRQDNPGLIFLVLIDSRLISSRARLMTSAGWGARWESNFIF
jgi:hypothetical protein